MLSTLESVKAAADYLIKRGKAEYPIKMDAQTFDFISYCIKRSRTKDRLVEWENKKREINAG